jgi:hypothetical protein
MGETVIGHDLDRLIGRLDGYELIAYGRREEYATREDAEQVARWLNRDEVGRARWVERAQYREVQS